MRTVAGLLGQRLGGQRSPQSVAPGHASGRLAVPNLAISGRQCWRVAYRQLLLAVPELGVIKLHDHALSFEGAGEVDGEVMG